MSSTGCVKPTTNTAPPDVTEPSVAKGLTTEEKIKRLTAAIDRIRDAPDLLTEGVAEDLKLINVRFSGTPRREESEINLRAIEHGVVEVCLNVWKQMFDKNFMKVKSIWNVMYRALSSLWNGSQQFKQICERLLKNDAHGYFLGVIQHPQITCSQGSDPIQLYTICGVLGIIHNLIIHLGSDARRELRKVDAVTILKEYLKHDTPVVKDRAFINLAFLMNEHENELINANDVHIRTIVQLLQDVASRYKNPKKGFAVGEIIEALNKLALISDINKKKILDSGAFECYERLLAEGVSADEQIIIIEGIWTSSFHKKCKDAFNKMSKLCSVLADLGTSQNEQVNKLANGALWVLKGNPRRKDTEKSVDVVDGEHIRISYHMDVRQPVLQIKHTLQEAGFKVSIDIADINGPTVDSMATAVETSTLLLVCMTQTYKESAACRAEAEYMNQLRKPFIPLHMEAGYKADGWLGIMIGTKVTFDFATDFKSAVTCLIEELSRRKRPGPSLNLPMVQALITEIGNSPLSKKPSSWSEEEVARWLKQNDLGHKLVSLPALDGTYLQELREMRRDAPEFFFSTLRNDLEFTFPDIMKFTVALKKLM